MLLTDRPASPFHEACNQIVAGQFMNVMSELAICQYAGDDAFYLFGCDWHQTLDDAKHQAEIEYEGVVKTWIDAA